MSSNDKALMVLDFDTMQRMAIALFESGYFDDVKSKAQAIVKVMAGNELGIPPFASMAGINIIHGKPALGANLIATLVKNDPRYDYRVQNCDDTSCTIAWLENGQSVGNSSFTIKEAQGAGLTGKDTWKKYTSDMLFARAITRGARRYAPGIFGGAPVYTPDELGADVDPDGYVEGEILEQSPALKKQVATGAETEEALMKEYADGLGADAEQPPKNGNGKKEPKFNGNTADARAWLEEKIRDNKVVLGIVGDALAMTGLYNGREHVKAWLDGDFEDAKALREQGLDTDLRKNVTGKGALKIFDTGVARKEPVEEGE